jgi:hypothetical protein
VHANFERCHQLTRDIIELGAKLAERAGRLHKPDSGRGEDRIPRLRQIGVITAGDEELMRNHTAVRDESQHAYVHTAPASIYQAAQRQLGDGRKLAGRLGAWTKELEDS